ncbi:hypothetical protein AX16_002112 [Volvariella volvacea WC 439]|nr:hypothetical protein AX16_002112 [Volvariella volvacea WC 439]
MVVWLNTIAKAAVESAKDKMKPERSMQSSSCNPVLRFLTSLLERIKLREFIAVVHAHSPTSGGRMSAKASLTLSESKTGCANYASADAVTIKQTGASDVSYIRGGGAFSASDKIVQHNGAGRVEISNFFANSFGKLYRSCGNCSTRYTRHVTINNVCLKGGSEGVGINSNFGDTATLSNVKTNGKPNNNNVCCTYQGVGSGSEPSKIGCGDSYSACQYTASAVGTC